MAGGISAEDIQKVREASDIVAIAAERLELRQRGRDFWCCCPFHNEKTPSCKIDPARQLWHCFGCGEGGDVFDFVKRLDNIDFPDAVRQLAEKAHIELHEQKGSGTASKGKKARLKAVCEETAAFYHGQLMRGKSQGAASARSYLAGRKFGGQVPKKWNLGYAPGRGQLVRHLMAKGFKAEEMIEANVAYRSKDNRVVDRFFDRVMFPINDAGGECIAFGGRVIGKGEPKYLNSQETPLFHKSNVLYGLDKAKNALTTSGTAIIVEGYTDVIALHEAGIENAVATLGTALTLQHIRLISRFARKRIIYLFDGDEAGQRAADRALGFIDASMTPEAGKTQVELCAVTLPDNLDPAEFVEQCGADALRAALEEAKPLISYGIERRLAAHNLSTPEGRTRALADALAVLAPIKDSLIAKDYAAQLAGRLNQREEAVLEALANQRVPQRYAQQGDTARADAAPGNQQRLDSGTEQGASAAQEAAGQSARFDEGELNRRRIERELLALCAQNPSVALLHAQDIAQTNWHEPVHARLSGCILDVLAKKPQASAAEVIAAAAQDVPRAAGILTSASDPEGDMESLVVYLVEELAIGDMEESIAALKAELAQQQGAIAESDRDLLFQSVVSLQKTLNAKRAEHKLR